MKDFMNMQDFILETPTAQHLFHDYAEKMPLADYHCHLNPQEIWENRRFNNLAEVWLGGENPDGTFAGDHYKWRVIRSNGVEEKYVTGMTDPYERFLKFVEALEMAGLSVVLFEKKNLGGVCLNEGCIPTKTLLYSAKVYGYAKHASKYAVYQFH